ncbi:MAG TPA: hypothetical protein VK961_03650 [Chthoniobacter sp.]|nr:hypothetical protein [Chthoniobacter sp.]
MLSPSLWLKKLPYLLALACVLNFTGCGEKKKTSAEIQKEKVDAFRKKQKIEAIKSYTELINKYPQSEHAEAAKERLKVLGPLPATPTPVKKK